MFKCPHSDSPLDLLGYNRSEANPNPKQSMEGIVMLKPKRISVGKAAKTQQHRCQERKNKIRIIPTIV